MSRAGWLTIKPDASGRPDDSDYPDDLQAATESHHAEAGSGTALALGLMGAVAMIGLFLSSLTTATQTRWQAQLAADLGAVAGATALRHGFDPCEIAREAVARNLAVYRTCELQPYGQVVVSVAVELNQFLGFRQISATARAGPRY